MTIFFDLYIKIINLPKEFWKTKIMSKKRFIIIIIAFFIMIIYFLTPKLEAGDRRGVAGGGVVPNRPTDEEMLILEDGHLVPGYYRNGYLYRHYYFHYPKEEKSPYDNLQYKPAGELQIKVKPAQAKVLVDGYALTQGEDLSYKIGLLTGKHRVKAQAEGFKPFWEEIQIQGGERKILSIELKK